MPTPNIHVQRHAVTPSTSPRFVIEDWVSMPESVLRRMPELREWDSLMRDRFQRMQEKMMDFVKAVQAEGE